VQEAACNTSLTQKWMFTGPLRQGANATLCLTRRLDVQTAGATLEQCKDGNEAQVWDYYF
jgi:Ricin-type beta-trefoil lectin domain